MAVYEISGSKLLRVARSVEGKLIQRYVSLVGLNKTQEKSARRKAKEIDRELARAQADAKAGRIREAKTSKGHSTGIRGISIVKRPHPAYRVQVQISGNSHVREFSIRRIGNERAWTQAKRFLSGLRGFKRVPANWTKNPPYKFKGRAGS
ncbi:MAG: hypothetical protein GKR90_25700 [Pseudomonadales bacterium]|nr:hypothetical protein [Pseudomonadales bacterium]